MLHSLTDQKLHYLATVHWVNNGKKKDHVWRVHTPLEEMEEEMVEDGLFTTVSEHYLSSYGWVSFKVTKYGKSVLKKVGPRVIALACLSMGDPVHMNQYFGELTLADLPGFLASGDPMVRETAKRVHDKLTGLT